MGWAKWPAYADSDVKIWTFCAVDIGEYWPAVVAVETEYSEASTTATSGRYSPVRLEQVTIPDKSLGTLAHFVVSGLSWWSRHCQFTTLSGGKGFPKIACQRIFLDQGLPKTYVVACRLVEALTLPDNWLASVTKRNQISVTLSGVCHRVPSSDVILISLYHFIMNSIG